MHMSRRIYLESRRPDALFFLHLDSAFLWERDRGRGLNEIGHSFFCNKSPVPIPTWRTRSGDFVKLQYKIRYKANELRGCGLKMPHKAHAVKTSRRSYVYMYIYIYLSLL